LPEPVAPVDDQVDERDVRAGRRTGHGTRHVNHDQHVRAAILRVQGREHVLDMVRPQHLERRGGCHRQGGGHRVDRRSVTLRPAQSRGRELLGAMASGQQLEQPSR
jgi:hypothetical protein